jgi:hypothetical protein
MNEARVFLSAVSSEFTSARHALVVDFGARQIPVQTQEQLTAAAGADTLLSLLHDSVRSCRAMVCLIGRRSGECPTDDEARPFSGMLPVGFSRASYTQWEVFFGRRYRLHMSYYISSHDYTPDQIGPTDQADLDRQTRFISYLKEEGVYRPIFSSIDHLCRLVMRQSWAMQRRRGDDILDQFRPAAVNAAPVTPFMVLLCGPTLTDLTKPSAALSHRIKNVLEADGFSVVLGEDDGLQEAQLRAGVNAQDEEIKFAGDLCDAVVLVADSPGVFSELGLYSWHLTDKADLLKFGKDRRDCVLLIDKTVHESETYLYKGPTSKVAAFGGAFYVDFASFDPGPILERLRQRRARVTNPKRGSRRRRP